MFNNAPVTISTLTSVSSNSMLLTVYIVIPILALLLVAVIGGGIAFHIRKKNQTSNIENEFVSARDDRARDPNYAVVPESPQYEFGDMNRPPTIACDELRGVGKHFAFLFGISS